MRKKRSLWRHRECVVFGTHPTENRPYKDAFCRIVSSIGTPAPWRLMKQGRTRLGGYIPPQVGLGFPSILPRPSLISNRRSLKLRMVSTAAVDRYLSQRLRSVVSPCPFSDTVLDRFPAPHYHGGNGNCHSGSIGTSTYRQACRFQYLRYWPVERGLGR